LADIYVSAVTCEAVINATSLKAAHTAVMAGSATVPIAGVLDVIFQTIEAPGGDEEQARLHVELSESLSQAEVLSAFDRHGPTLWEEPNESWDTWLRSRFLATYGAALSQAACHVCPQLDLGDLIVDLDAGPQADLNPSEEVWLTEEKVGGSGFIESLRDRVVRDPRSFFEVLEAVLGPADGEIVDIELSRLIQGLVPDGPMATAFAAVRAAHHATYEALLVAVADLQRLLVADGFIASHAVTTSLHARVLKLGSAATTDELLQDYLTQWSDEELRCGIEIDSRVFAYSRSLTSELDGALAHLSAPTSATSREQWRYSTLYGLFWPRGSAALTQSLRARNPFAAHLNTDRRLALAALERDITIVDVGESDWQLRLAAALARDGEAGLAAGLSDASLLKEALLQLLLVPLDIGDLLVHPRSAGVSRSATGTVIRFRVPEAVQ